MSLSRNIKSPLPWSWRTMLAAALLAAAGPARADEGPSVPRLDWSHARRAFHQLETWVRRGNVDTTDPLEPIPVSDLAAVRVTVRQFGHTLGTGDLVLDHSAANDLLDATAAAAGRAIPNAAATLNDRFRRAARLGDQDKRLAVPQWSDISASFTVDLQLAFGPRRISLPADAPTGAIYRQFAPGYHGLRLHPKPQHADTPPAWLWPGTTLALNMPPRGQINHLLAKLGYHLERDLRRLAKPNGPVLERFGIIHLARPAIDQPIQQLTRGNVLLPRKAIRESTLGVIATRLADHLRRRQRDDGSFSGIFNPTANRFKTHRAESGPSALAALALTRFANHHTDDQQIDRAHLAAQQAIDFLLPRLLDEQQPAQPLAMALAVLTIIESPRLAGYQEHRDALAGRLASLADEQGLFRSRDEPNATTLDPTRHAIVVAALAGLYEQTRDPDLAVHLHRSLEAGWKLLRERPAVGPLPWLIDAQFTMHRLGKPAADHRAPMDLIRDLIKQRLARQILRRPDLGPPDVLGGFQFTGDPAAGSAPRPDWRSAYGLMVIAAAVGRPALSDENDRLRQTVNGALAARFIAQLMYEPANSYYVANPSLVQGAVRAALHDNTLSITATAVSLLAVTEFQKAVKTVD